MSNPSLPAGQITSVRSALRLWFRQPRAHGQLIYDRRVTWLELFYDLVFVVLVSQITHRLAEHHGWGGVLEYLVMYLLIWLLWTNGSYYQELHGQNDGRSRLYIFGQMTFLVVLTTYAAEAVADSAAGFGFGVTFFVLVLQLAYQWWHLRRVDAPEFRRTVAIYVSILLLTGVIVLAGALVADGVLRTGIWGIAAAINVVATGLSMIASPHESEGTSDVTESWAERMGLFVIVVLGEVVVGVGDGLTQGEATPTHLLTGILMLLLGFAIWWSYFDLVGRREPLPGNSKRTVWMTAHMTLSGAIAAVGAGMVTMIEHSEDAIVPLSSRALIAGSLAVVLLSLAGVVSTLPKRPALRHSLPTLFLGVAACIGLSFVPLSPVLFALLLPLPLWLTWGTAFTDAAHAGELIIEADEVITPAD